MGVKKRLIQNRKWKIRASGLMKFFVFFTLFCLLAFIFVSVASYLHLESYKMDRDEFISDMFDEYEQENSSH